MPKRHRLLLLVCVCLLPGGTASAKELPFATRSPITVGADGASAVGAGVSGESMIVQAVNIPVT